MTTQYQIRTNAQPNIHVKSSYASRYISQIYIQWTRQIRTFCHTDENTDERI